VVLTIPSCHGTGSTRQTQDEVRKEKLTCTFNTKGPQFVYPKESVLIQYLLTSSSQRWSVQERKSHSKQPPLKHYRIQINDQLNLPEKQTVEICCLATQANVLLRKIATKLTIKNEIF